jgi:hypothetical protein
MALVQDLRTALLPFQGLNGYMICYGPLCFRLETTISYLRNAIRTADKQFLKQDDISLFQRGYKSGSWKHHCSTARQRQRFSSLLYTLERVSLA